MKMKIGELLKLEMEISGLRKGNEVPLKGLLKEALSQNVKHELFLFLNRELKDHKDFFERSRNELLTKWGKKIGRTYSLEKVIKNSDNEDVLNPNYAAYMSEIQSLLDKEVELSKIPQLKEEDFDFVSEHFYPLSLELFLKFEKKV